MVIDALASALVALCEAPMTGPSETLPALGQRPTEGPLAFERLGAACLRGRTAIERPEIGRQRGDVLSGIEALAAPAAGQRLNQTEPPSPDRVPCWHRPTFAGWWSPRCWRWSSGRRMRRHLSKDFHRF